MITKLPAGLLKKVRPRRAIAGSARAPSKRAVTALRKKLAGRSARRHLDVFDEGVGDGPEPELGPVQEAAVALLRNLSEDAIRAADIEVLAASMHLTRRAGEGVTLVPSVVVSRGLTDAVATAAESLRFSLDAASGGWTTAVYLITQRGRRRDRIDDGMALRHAVCAATEEAYGEATERASGLRAPLGPLDRAYLAHVFPDEPWANEDLRALLGDNNTEYDRYGNLLSAATDPELVTELCTRYPFGVGVHALDIAYGLSEEAAITVLAAALPGMLGKPTYGPLLKTPPRTVVSALSLYPTPRVAELLAPHVGSAVLGPLTAAFFQDNPALQDVLQAHARGRGARAAVETIVAQAARASADGAPEASADEVPILLRDRPWRPRKRRPKPVVVEGVTLPNGYEERVEARAADELPHGSYEARDMTAEELERWRRHETNSYSAADVAYKYQAGGLCYLRVPTEEGLAAWNAGKAGLSAGDQRWVAKHGLDALPGFVRSDLRRLDWDDPEDLFCALESYISPRMAPVMARIAARRKKWRPRAERWLVRNAPMAALGLIPDAVGGAKAARADAEGALLLLTHACGEAPVREAAARYDSGVVGVIDELLARDPLAIDVKPIKLPAFLRAADLPQVRLNSGGRLPEDARNALIELLSIVPASYPGFDHLRQVCDEPSLADLASALLEQWVLGDAPGRHEWMLHSVVRFPSETSSRRVAALARDWARNKKVKATRACAALAALGTDVALLHLGHIAETSRFEDLRAATRLLLDDAARTRGLSREELEDRTVPDLGLGPDGTLSLSYGSRQFVATLNENLQVVIRDLDGNLLTGVPRTRKDDDATAGKSARERLKALKKDVTSIADRQVRRMERAMVDGRWFDRAGFVTRIATHPVMMHLAKGLVWEARTQDVSPKAPHPKTFRVAEDGTFADVHDETIMLAEEDRVRVAHPCRTDLRAGWPSVFADYELLQPFEQLGRATFEPTDEEQGGNNCLRGQGVVLAPQKVLGIFEARGYRRNNGGLPSAYLKTWPGNVTVTVTFSPGIEIAYLESSGAQTIGDARFERAGEALPISEVDPVVFSEVARDLNSLTR